MRWKKYSVLLSIIVSFPAFLLVFSLASCEKPKVKEKSMVKLGAILPLTGPLNARAQQEKEAIELAIADFNSANSDVALEVIFEDSHGRLPEHIALKLLQTDKVSAIIASTTPVSRSIYTLANKHKVIMVMLCSDPTIQKESPYIFRLYESKEVEAEQIVRYFAITGEKVAVLYLDQQDITNQLINYIMPNFKKNQVKILFYAPYETGRVNFKESIDGIKNSGADSFLILGSGDELQAIFEELSRQKLIGKIKIVGGISLLSLTDTTALPNGVIAAVPRYVIEKNEKAKVFESDFQKINNHSPNLYAAFAYNAAQILAEGLAYAFMKGGGNPETVTFHVVGRKYQGILGDVSIDNEGALIIPMELTVIREGKILPLNVEKK
jgi:ABC-type branched-subunit amino acid transport system substrate-binding protein